MASKKKPVPDRVVVLKRGRHWYYAVHDKQRGQWTSPSRGGGYGYGSTPDKALDAAIGYGARGYLTQRECIDTVRLAFNLD
jgi:hypothetical protein